MGGSHPFHDDPVTWVLVILFIGIPTSYVGAVFVQHQIVVHQCHAKGPGYELGDGDVCIPPPKKGRPKN